MPVNVTVQTINNLILAHFQKPKNQNGTAKLQPTQPQKGLLFTYKAHEATDCDELIKALDEYVKKINTDEFSENHIYDISRIIYEFWQQSAVNRNRFMESKNPLIRQLFTHFKESAERYEADQKYDQDVFIKAYQNLLKEIKNLEYQIDGLKLENPSEKIQILNQKVDALRRMVGCRMDVSMDNIVSSKIPNTVPDSYNENFISLNPQYSKTPHFVHFPETFTRIISKVNLLHDDLRLLQYRVSHQDKSKQESQLDKGGKLFANLSYEIDQYFNEINQQISNAAKTDKRGKPQKMSASLQDSNYFLLNQISDYIKNLKRQKIDSLTPLHQREIGEMVARHWHENSQFKKDFEDSSLFVIKSINVNFADEIHACFADLVEFGKIQKEIQEIRQSLLSNNSTKEPLSETALIEYSNRLHKMMSLIGWIDPSTQNRLIKTHSRIENYDEPFTQNSHKERERNVPTFFSSVSLYHTLSELIHETIELTSLGRYKIREEHKPAFRGMKVSK